MKKYKIFLILLLYCTFGVLSYAEEKKPKYNEIKITSDTWHLLTKADGGGLYFDLIKAVYEPIGIKVKITIVPYTRSVLMVKKGESDAWVASFHKEQEFAIYPQWHFDRNKQMVLAYKNSSNNFVNIDSLKGKKVIWLRGFNLNRYIPIKLNYSEIDYISSAFLLLKNGRQDYFIGAESDIKTGLGENKIVEGNYDIDFLMYLNLYLAFGNTEKGKYFLEIWDKRMETLKNDKNFLKIYEKYGYPNPFL